jgi:hypothetical protein
VSLFGISTPFEVLSQITRQIIYALLTRAPLSWKQASNHVRLACVRHAASVRSEPGSNSPVYTEKLNPFFCFKETSLEPTIHGVYYLVFKDQARCPFRCGRISTLTDPLLPVNYFFRPAIFFSKELPGRRCGRFRLAEVANNTSFRTASQLLFSASILFSKASLVAVATNSLSEPQKLLAS